MGGNLCRTYGKQFSIYDGFAKCDHIVSRVYEDHKNGRTSQNMSNQSFAVLEKNIHNVCGKEIGKREEVVYQDQVGNEQCANTGAH